MAPGIPWDHGIHALKLGEYGFGAPEAAPSKYCDFGIIFHFFAVSINPINVCPTPGTGLLSGCIVYGIIAAGGNVLVKIRVVKRTLCRRPRRP